MIANRTADTIELTKGISIEVRPANYKTLRGPTYICIVCDEIASWFTSVDFANPDVEVLASIKLGLMTTPGPLLSSLRPTPSTVFCLIAINVITAPTVRRTSLLLTVPAAISIYHCRKKRSTASWNATQSEIGPSIYQYGEPTLRASLIAPWSKPASVTTSNCRRRSASPT